MRYFDLFPIFICVIIPLPPAAPRVNFFFHVFFGAAIKCGITLHILVYADRRDRPRNLQGFVGDFLLARVDCRPEGLGRGSAEVRPSVVVAGIFKRHLRVMGQKCCRG